MIRSLYTSPEGRSIALAAVVAIALGACALLPAGKRALNHLKNRTAIPSQADYDPTVSLETVLAPGDDRDRWSVERAASIQGYVMVVKQAEIESANRFSLTRRDTHIEVGLRPDAPPRERMILEVTPPLQDWARSQGLDWSTEALQRTLVGRMCRFGGWLFFDTEHAEESENTNPGGRGNWRATAWEVHPVTSIEVLDSIGAPSGPQP